MSTLAVVREHAYVDSVTLLQVSAEVLGLPGVEDAALVMATDLNRELLRESGLLAGEAMHASANDLVVSVRATSEATARAALEQAEALVLRRRVQPSGESTPNPPRSIHAARRLAPGTDLAVISVPGPFAAGEARQALAEGMHVFLFSDNVPLQDEVALKRAARQRNLLVMGPDCGTAILSGVGLGFANVVSRGSIGVVGASGTGIQEVTSLVHQLGGGISHAIGTGSRDLHADVGAVTTLQALGLLRDDPRTETIVLISKPPDADVSRRVLRALAHTGKRAVAYLQATPVEMPDGPDGVMCTSTLEGAARVAVGEAPSEGPMRMPRPPHGAPELHGLFCGGTLRHEAASLLGAGPTLEDFGDVQYTRGRAHPMIDPTLRNQAIAHAGRDARVGVLLLDFILGLGAHADPVGAALPAIQDARDAARADGRELSVAAHVVGTDHDPQGLARQEALLRTAGVQVYGSNAAAAKAAATLLHGLTVS
jgi:succinyl-CoA synthetase alpha subunit